jgi:hypothetical protein
MAADMDAFRHCLFHHAEKAHNRLGLACAFFATACAYEWGWDGICFLRRKICDVMRRDGENGLA